MKHTWLPLASVAQLTGWSARHVQRLAARHEIQSRPAHSEAPRANGKRSREYLLSSLPAAAQLTYARQLIGQEPPAKSCDGLALVKSPSLQRPLFSDPIVLTSDDLRTLTADQEQIVRQRLDAITPLIHWADGVRPSPSLRPAGGLEVSNSDQLAACLAAQHQVSRGTIWRWLKQYRAGGVKALARDRRSDSGQSRLFAQYPNAEKFVLAKFNEGCSVAWIHDALQREWPNMYNHGSSAPSYTTVRAYINSIPAVVRDASRLTAEQHNARHAPHLIRGYGDLRPNQVWVSDHRIHDFFVQNDRFDHLPRLCAFRLWETAIEDMRSRAIVASVWNTTPSSRTIASALRMAIARFGLPELFYIDNGKDYRKIGKGAELSPADADLDSEGRVTINAATQGLLARLGIKVKYCTPYRPQSKPIESYFSYQAQRLDRLFGEAYAGSKPALRPEACDEALAEHERFLEGKSSRTVLPLASEAIAVALYWTEERNALHKHSGRGMNHRAAYDIFNELLPVEQRRLVDVRQIEELFWDRQERVVSQSAAQLYNATYEGADPESAAAMWDANGSRILVACDPNNLGEALAYRLDGSFLARLSAQQLVGFSEQNVAQVMKARNALRKQAKHFWTVASQGVPTERDYLRGRAGIIPAAQPGPSPTVAPSLPAAFGGQGGNRRRLAAAVAPAYVEDVVSRVLDMEDED